MALVEVPDNVVWIDELGLKVMMLLLFPVFLFVVDIVITISFFIISVFFRTVIVISTFVFVSFMVDFVLLKLLKVIRNAWTVERARVLKLWPNVLHLHFVLSVLKDLKVVTSLKKSPILIVM